MFSRLTRLGLGGRMGGGKQYFAWLHEKDFCAMVNWFYENENTSGVYNCCSPYPIPNREFMRVLRRVYGVRFGLPSPRWLLTIGAFFLRTETELPLKSRFVVPGRLKDEGFSFAFPKIEDAMQDLVEKG